MIYDVLINMPAEVEFTALPVAVQEAIRQFQGEWPAGVMPGTQAVNGRRITHVLVNVDAPDPLSLLESTIAEHDLDWLVLAMQAAELDVEGRVACLRAVPASMLAYLPDLDAQGARPSDLSSLHRYAGHPAWVIAG
ncbi:MAG: hypothetical protein HQL66_09555 [Magnetococcales bacterium]|nr:hypothetical protein [Magnetococcales bacterium]